MVGKEGLGTIGRAVVEEETSETPPGSRDAGEKIDGTFRRLVHSSGMTQPSEDPPLNRPERLCAAMPDLLGPFDPRTPAAAPSQRRGLLEPAVVGLFLLALLVALHAAAALVVPMISAVIFGSVIAHVGDRASRIGVPPIAAAMALVGATGFGLFFLGSALADAIAGLVERVPEIATRIDGLIADLVAPFATVGAHLLGGGSFDGQSTGGLSKLASSIDLTSLSVLLAGLTPALGEVLIFLATLAFFVAGRSTLRRNAILTFEARENRLAAIRVINACEADLATYFGTTAAINLGVGTLTGVIAWSGGLAAPVLWGVLTVLLSFVPFLGPAVVALGLFSAALLTHDGILAVAWPATAFLVVHLVSENAVVPSILGRRFEVNPFVVFLAIVSGTWLWGPMGAVLAVPLLLVARAVRGAMRGDGAECGLPD